MKLKAYFAQLKIDLEPMTFSEKVDHIWTYNKELILIVGGLLFLTIGLLVTFLQKPDVVFCGYLVNGEFNQEGTSYLTSDYGDVIGVTGKQEVQMLTGVYNTTLTSALEISNATRQEIAALCMDASLDYIIADKVTMDSLVLDGICIDLSTFFTEEEFAQLQDRMLYGTPRDESEIPFAVNISNTKFFKDCVTTNNELYICFIENTKHLDRCHEIWDYLNNWK